MFRMRFKTTAILLGCLALILTGCMTNNQDRNHDTQRMQNLNNNDNRGPQALRNDDNGNDFRPLQDAIGNDGRGTGMQNDRNNMNDRIEVADKAAEKIANVKGVRQANVLVTRRNAYVAAALDSGKMTREIEDQIAKQVRATDSNIQNVYVSTNPEFIDRVNAYVDDVQQGRPVQGFVEQFNEFVARIFPNAR